MKRLLPLTVAAVALAFTLGFAAPQARAGHGYAPPVCHVTYKKVVTFKCVIVYETRREAYVHYITEYDHCGRPFPVKKICYRLVKVPVKKTIPVVRYVKVCH